MKPNRPRCRARTCLCVTARQGAFLVPAIVLVLAVLAAAWPSTIAARIPPPVADPYGYDGDDDDYGVAPPPQAGSCTGRIPDSGPVTAGSAARLAGAPAPVPEPDRSGARKTHSPATGTWMWYVMQAQIRFLVHG